MTVIQLKQATLELVHGDTTRQDTHTIMNAANSLLAGVEAAPDGFSHPPFKWDEERRAYLRAELDALYAHLYSLTREELDYILDTFPIVRRKDEERYGEYRTKRLVLEYYERLEPLRH